MNRCTKFMIDGKIYFVLASIVAIALVPEVYGKSDPSKNDDPTVKEKVEICTEKKVMTKSKVNRNTPYGWFLAGTHPFEYRAKLDKKKFHSGTRSCRVEFKGKKKPSGWTTIMQNMGPKPYLGKRLRMRFWVRTQDVNDIAGWMRVDGRGKGEMLSFENMCNRKLSGSHDWTEQEIVLDVPTDSTNIGFGVIFYGKGKMWIDDVTFETVSKKVPTTSCPCSPGIGHPPKNLDFESDEKDDE